MNRTTLTFSLILVSIISLLSLSGCQIATPLKSVASKELDPNAELLVVETHAKSGQQGHGEVYRQTGKLLDSMEGWRTAWNDRSFHPSNDWRRKGPDHDDLGRRGVDKRIRSWRNSSCGG